MNEEIKVLKQEAEMARMEYRAGHISRGEAQERITPYLDMVNTKSKELAKKYNQKPKLVNFSAYVR